MHRRFLTRVMTSRTSPRGRAGKSTIFLAAVSFYPYLEIIYKIQSRLSHSSLSAEVDGNRFKAIQIPLYPQTLAQGKVSHRLLMGTGYHSSS